MNRKQGFYAMFYLFEKYVNVYHIGFSSDGWDLSLLYGNMTPISKESPSDYAYWADWQRLLDASSISENLDNNQLLQAIEDFAGKYEAGFGFDLGDAPAKLDSIDENDPDLLEAIEKAGNLLVDWGEPL